jgi:hypothetical protein
MSERHFMEAIPVDGMLALAGPWRGDKRQAHITDTRWCPAYGGWYHVEVDRDVIRGGFIGRPLIVAQTVDLEREPEPSKPRRRCKQCGKREAVYAMQFIGADTMPAFYVLGHHIRGFRVMPVCAECADVLKEEFIRAKQED